MKRILLSLAAVLVTLVGVFWPVAASVSSSSSSSTPDPVSMSSYRSDYTISRAGNLTAVETITADFPSGRHGIFRYWDLADFSDHTVRYVPKNIHVTFDGRPVDTSLSWEQGRRYRVAKIGDADTTVTPGSHVYVIRYTIKGVLASSDAGSGDASSSWAGVDKGASTFLWQVVAAGWDMDIARSTSVVHLPGTASGAECSAKDVACQVTGDGTDTVTVTTGALSEHSPVALRVGTAVPTPDRATVPWPVALDGSFGHSVALLVVLVVLGLVGFGVALALTMRSRERAPGFPVMYEPPPGLGPVQTVYVADESIPAKALVATLLYQAEQGLTELTAHDGGHWTIAGKGTPEQWAATDDVTRSVGTTLGVTTVGAEFEADGSATSGQKLQEVGSSMAYSVKHWGTESKALAVSISEQGARGLVIAAAALAAVCFVLQPFHVTALGLPFAGFVIGGAGLFVAGVGTRRTATGRELWSRSGGFERLLSTPSNKERLDFGARKDLYTSFIPYAIAFGCADRWAAKYRTATGTEPPIPLWFGGGYYAGAGYGFFGGDAFSGFESSLSSSISAYQATQSSSSGGGDFSGSFGGGGGGGGGGSW